MHKITRVLRRVSQSTYNRATSEQKLIEQKWIHSLCLAMARWPARHCAMKCSNSYYYSSELYCVQVLGWAGVYTSSLFCVEMGTEHSFSPPPHNPGQPPHTQCSLSLLCSPQPSPCNNYIHSPVEYEACVEYHRGWQ